MNTESIIEKAQSQALLFFRAAAKTRAAYWQEESQSGPDHPKARALAYQYQARAARLVDSIRLVRLAESQALKTGRA